MTQGYTELQIITQAPKDPIQANLSALREYIALVTKRFEGALYSDDQIKLAKKERADLRRLKESIDTKRKALKAAWNAPYIAFENELKEILAQIDKPVMLIDHQVKDFEARQKQARRDYLQEVFDKANTLGALLSFDKVVTDEMLRASVTQARAGHDLSEKVAKIAEEVANLEALLNPAYRTEVLSAYFKDFNFAGALLKQKELETEKAMQEAVLGAAETAPEPTPTPAPTQATQADTKVATGNGLVQTRRFVITGTSPQFAALKRFCWDNNIKFREVM
ncbi:MAG: DUF1351 domain-containing protein [Elusimicrobiaceae bacterium]|nr:DUF1351 domain-containing protein [Elusimicrobiaceae bacterium]